MKAELREQLDSKYFQLKPYREQWVLPGLLFSNLKSTCNTLLGNFEVKENSSIPNSRLVVSVYILSGSKSQIKRSIMIP